MNHHSPFGNQTHTGRPAAPEKAPPGEFLPRFKPTITMVVTTGFILVGVVSYIAALLM